MNIRKARITQNFVTVHNRVAQNIEIPLEVKGLWLDLISRPDDWVILPKYLAKQYGIGRDKMYKILNLMIEAKLCRREQSRQRDENGREVYGTADYVIYASPEDWEEMEKSVDTEVNKTVPCPENQYTESQYTVKEDTTKTDLKTKKEKQQRAAVSQEVVVFLPQTMKLAGISEDRIKSLIDEFGPNSVEAKAKLLHTSAGDVSNVYGWLRKAIEEDWQPKAAPADLVEGHKKWAKETVDGRSIGPIRIEALNSQLEFVYTTGRKAPDVFDYSLSGFKEIVTAHYQSIKDRFNAG